MRLELTKDLDALRAEAKWFVDASAEAVRLHHITPGSGQALEYQQSADEAFALPRDPDPQPENYPMLVAEQEALAEVGVVASLAEVAQQVRQEHGQSRALGALIKRRRRAAKMRIDAAATPAEIDAAKRVDWSDLIDP